MERDFSHLQLVGPVSGHTAGFPSDFGIVNAVWCGHVQDSQITKEQDHSPLPFPSDQVALDKGKAGLSGLGKRKVGTEEEGALSAQLAELQSLSHL